MKKMMVLFIITCLTVTLFTVTPARADRFWTGVAIGASSAVLLGALLSAPRSNYSSWAYPPAYQPSRYYYPSAPVYRERWDRGYWSGRPVHHGNVHPYRGYGHWERRY
jgi:hypothetical protein